MIVLRHNEASHPMWQGIDADAAFHAWWPGQFAIDDDTDVSVLASYANPLAGSYVTDLPVGPAYDWRKWEEAYGINLNPKRIIKEPAVVEGRFGKGKVLLSYLHFETPDDEAGNRVLINLMEHLAGKAVSPVGLSMPAVASILGEHSDREINKSESAGMAEELAEKADGFIKFGKLNFLWYERNDWLLQWRRGVRGIEYSALSAMLRQIDRLVSTYGEEDGALRDSLEALRAKVIPFLDDARKLLMLERHAMSLGPIKPLKTDDKEIAALREQLFSTSKRCGGDYEQIVDLADGILLPLLQRELAS
jgi:hypothetical protein